MLESKFIRSFFHLPQAVLQGLKSFRLAREKRRFGKSIKPYSHGDLLEMAKEIPESNGSQYFRKIDMSVAIVTDEFMFNYYKDVFRNLTYLTPENYTSYFAENQCDLFLYVSCWTGIFDNEWRGIGVREKPAKAFDAILEICRERNIPTVFQTIEDPSNYERFLGIAKRFDSIFTTDLDKIDDYKRDCRHEKVFYGEYGVNPLLNNPIGMHRETINGAFFAGSYPARYAGRCADMRMIFDSIIQSGQLLVVADRKFTSRDAAVRFPETYAGHIIPPIDHKELQKVHKLFRYNLNFNSIQHSPSMCAMRVYELQGQGALILSNYARSVSEKFPNVQILGSPADLLYLFGSAPGWEEYEERVVAIRQVMTDKTVFDQNRRMLRAIGLCPEPLRSRRVLILCDTCDEQVMKSVGNQVYNAWDLLPLGQCTADLDGEYDYLAFFGAGHEYEAYYLVDMLNGFKYTNSTYITKEAFFDGEAFREGAQHDYVTRMPCKYRTVFDLKAVSLEELIGLQGSAVMEGGYSIDPFELNYTRFCARQSEAERK